MTDFFRFLRKMSWWIASCFVAISIGLNAQRSGPPEHDAQARQDFAASCAGCHGLDGRGGERAPNIASRKEVLRLSDDNLFGIIQNGIVGTGMPAFRQLKKARINAIVGYLRLLQGKTASAKLPGNPESGKKLFFGTAQCSRCHTIQGDGGLIGSDLFAYAGNLSSDELREAIIDAGTAGTRSHKLVAVKLNEGQRLEGVIRNEDNFSAQLQTLDGAFHSLKKSSSVIPPASLQITLLTDYTGSLNASELNDIISYLMILAPKAEEGSVGSNSSVQQSGPTDNQ
ncbi:MAG TPA: c-type cytochrome [Terriglobales bacterium]|nr:c-type cytochrome [Terriglobales bacterium]